MRSVERAVVLLRGSVRNALCGQIRGSSAWQAATRVVRRCTANGRDATVPSANEQQAAFRPFASDVEVVSPLCAHAERRKFQIERPPVSDWNLTVQHLGFDVDARDVVRDQRVAIPTEVSRQERANRFHVPVLKHILANKEISSGKRPRADINRPELDAVARVRLAVMVDQLWDDVDAQVPCPRPVDETRELPVPASCVNDRVHIGCTEDRVQDSSIGLARGDLRSRSRTAAPKVGSVDLSKDFERRVGTGHDPGSAEACRLTRRTAIAGALITGPQSTGPGRRPTGCPYMPIGNSPQDSVDHDVRLSSDATFPIFRVSARSRHQSDAKLPPRHNSYL